MKITSTTLTALALLCWNFGDTNISTTVAAFSRPNLVFRSRQQTDRTSSYLTPRGSNLPSFCFVSPFSSKRSCLRMALKEPEVKERKATEPKNPSKNAAYPKVESTTEKEVTQAISKIAEKPTVEPIIEPIKKEIENWEQESQKVEMLAVGAWIVGISAFVFINNFVGPWPEPVMSAVPREVWGLAHAVAGMLFGGGIILTAAFEWLVTSSKNKDILSFYFDKIPMLDAMIVLPALTVSMISGTGLAIAKYDGLGLAPSHVKYTLWCLTAFATWWATTDVTTQSSSLKAINEWRSNTNKDQHVPKVIEFRSFSNLVSCGFVLALYYIMVVKPGYY